MAEKRFRDLPKPVQRKVIILSILLIVWAYVVFYGSWWLFHPEDRPWNRPAPSSGATAPAVSSPPAASVPKPSPTVDTRSQNQISNNAQDQMSPETVAKLFATNYYEHPLGDTPEALAEAVRPYATNKEYQACRSAMKVPPGVKVARVDVASVPIPPWHQEDNYRIFDCAVTTQDGRTTHLQFAMVKTETGWKVDQEGQWRRYD